MADGWWRTSAHRELHKPERSPRRPQEPGELVRKRTTHLVNTTEISPRMLFIRCSLAVVNLMIISSAIYIGNPVGFALIRLAVYQL